MKTLLAIITALLFTACTKTVECDSECIPATGGVENVDYAVETTMIFRAFGEYTIYDFETGAEVLHKWRNKSANIVNGLYEADTLEASLPEIIETVYWDVEEDTSGYSIDTLETGKTYNYSRGWREVVESIW